MQDLRDSLIRCSVVLCTVYDLRQRVRNRLFFISDEILLPLCCMPVECLSDFIEEVFLIESTLHVLFDIS